MKPTAKIVTLSNQIIRQAKVPATGRTTLRDALVPGFEVRISHTGHKSFNYKFTCPDTGKPGCRLSLGRFPFLDAGAARSKARDAGQMVTNGINPAFKKAQAKAAISKTFGEVLELFIEKEAKKKRAWKQVEDRLRYNLGDWMNRPVKSIDQDDCEEAVMRVRDRGADVEANRLVSHLSKLFKWALEKRHIGTLPFETLEKTEEIERDRVLSDGEIKNIWSACDVLAWPFGFSVKLMFLTGQRVQEVGQMQRAHVNLNAKIRRKVGQKVIEENAALWTIPKIVKKENRPNILPLSDFAADIFSSLPEFNSVYVFPASGNLRNPASGYSKAKKKIDKLSGVTDWQFRDIRRTVTTGMAEMCVDPHVADKILNHSAGAGAVKGTAAIYNQYAYLPQKKDALAEWADRIQAIVTPMRQAAE